MKEKDLRDRANQVAGEFQTKSDVEALTKARSKPVAARVMTSVNEWQQRQLDPRIRFCTLAALLYDNVVLKIRHNQRVINRSMCLALGVG